MNIMGMAMNMGMDMGMGPGAMMPQKENFLMSFFHKLPLWGQGLALAFIVIVLAWIAGIIIGKLYASVKYPDPEKPSLVNPLVKIGLGAAVIICGIWIFSSFIKPDEPSVPVDGPDETVSQEDLPEENGNGPAHESPAVTAPVPGTAQAENVAVG